MRGWSSRVAHLVAVVLLVGVASAAHSMVEPEEPPAPRTVTLDLRNVPLDEAIARVVAATDLSVMIAGPLPKEPRITMRLANADPVGTLALLASTGGLEFQTSSGVVSYARGGPVPLAEVVLISARSERPRVPWERRAGPAAPAPEAAAPPVTVGPIAVNVAVDLNAKDVPFRDAIAQIAKQIPSTSHVRLVVDESVPKDLRVNARLSKMPLNWVIDSLVQQAGLTYGVQDEPDPQFKTNLEGRVREGLMSELDMQTQLANAPRLHTVYIVPKPELHVSGGAGGASAGPM